MSDKLAFLDEPQGSKDTTAPTPEPAKVEAPPPAQEPPPATDPPPVEPPKPTPKEPGEWTVAMAMDERDKRIAIQRERDELAAWKAEQERKAQTQEPPIDPLTEPEKWQATQDQKLRLLEQDLVWRDAQRRALRDFGAETVQAAFAALNEECKTNPAFYKTVERQPEPYEFVVKWHKRQQILARMGDDDPETFAEKLAKEKGWIIPERGPDGKFVAAAPAPATSTPLPKPSLAAAPAATGNVPKTPAGEGVAFGKVFSE